MRRISARAAAEAARQLSITASATRSKRLVLLPRSRRPAHFDHLHRNSWRRCTVSVASWAWLARHLSDGVRANNCSVVCCNVLGDFTPQEATWCSETFSDRGSRARSDKYRLSLMDPRDDIVLWTELDDHCDRLAVDRRYCQSTDDGPVYHALSVHLLTNFDDRNCFTVATLR